MPRSASTFHMTGLTSNPFPAANSRPVCDATGTIFVTGRVRSPASTYTAFTFPGIHTRPRAHARAAAPGHDTACTARNRPTGTGRSSTITTSRSLRPSR
jgi:hypothetical protein